MRRASPKLADLPPEIFTVDELSALLNGAAKRAPDVVPMLAIGAFAEVREAEIKRLDWSEVGASSQKKPTKTCDTPKPRERRVVKARDPQFQKSNCAGKGRKKGRKRRSVDSKRSVFAPVNLC
jgi:hypothetical protein